MAGCGGCDWQHIAESAQTRLRVEIVREIAREDGLSFRMAVIHSEQDKPWLRERLASGRVRPLGNAAPLTQSDIDRAERMRYSPGLRDAVREKPEAVAPNHGTAR